MAGYDKTTGHYCPPPLSRVNTQVAAAGAARLLALGFTFDAAKARVDSIARGAEFTEWLVILDVAGGLPGAAVGGTWVHTLVGHTGLAGGTPFVPQADGDGGRAVFHADTHGAMIEHVALLVWGAGAAHGTGVGTPVVDTGQVVCALFVSAALDWACCTHNFSH